MIIDKLDWDIYFDTEKKSQDDCIDSNPNMIELLNQFQQLFTSRHIFIETIHINLLPKAKNTLNFFIT